MSLEELAEFREEALYFYSLCGERDKNFLDSPPEKRETADYARLITIAFALGFKWVCAHLTEIAEDKTDIVFDRVKAVKNDYATIKKWVDEFIENIPIPGLKAVMLKNWKEKLSRIDKDNFAIKQLFLQA